MEPDQCRPDERGDILIFAWLQDIRLLLSHTWKPLQQRTASMTDKNDKPARSQEIRQADKFLLSISPNI